MKTKRNDYCPCGSGKKYKKCCLQKQTSNNIKADEVKADKLDGWAIKLLKNNIDLKLGEKAVYSAITYFVVLLVALREGTTVECESNDLKQNGGCVPSADRMLGNIKKTLQSKNCNLRLSQLLLICLRLQRNTVSLGAGWS